MDEICNEIMEAAGTGWECQDDTVLLSCCGDSVEWDCHRCPTCGAVNPLIAQGLI